MAAFDRYDGRIIRVTDTAGNTFLGEAHTFHAESGLDAYGREEDGIMIHDVVRFASQILKVETLSNLCIIRATQTFQQAGAYYVRIQAMARKHHITLRQEFDEHDGPDTKYIVVTDADFPIATARMYPIDEQSMMIGRVVVLPEFRHQGIGTMVVQACEAWAGELGYARTALESRDNKVAFYAQMGYEVCGEAMDGDTFRCIRMEKALRSPGPLPA